MYSDPDRCDYCRCEGCSPTCPGPDSLTTCPSCGARAHRHEGVVTCRDFQGCGYSR